MRPSVEWLRDQYEAQGRDSRQIARDLKIDPKTAFLGEGHERRAAA